MVPNCATKAPSVTERGDPRIAAQIYAASPETASSAISLRGTGGSVYFLRRQDITGGSVNVTIQNIDPDTGRVVSSTDAHGRRGFPRRLPPGRADPWRARWAPPRPMADWYPMAPAPSTRTSSCNTNTHPSPGTGDATAFGGRVEAWATDRLRFGATLMSESAGADDQVIGGADIRFQRVRPELCGA